MTEIPRDFGGFVGWWDEGPRAYLLRYGEGKPIEGVSMTPLNLLQAHKTLGALIEEGRHDGQITDEHLRQSEQLPNVAGIENVQPREQVDEIAGPD